MDIETARRITAEAIEADLAAVLADAARADAERTPLSLNDLLEMDCTANEKTSYVNVRTALFRRMRDTIVQLSLALSEQPERVVAPMPRRASRMKAKRLGGGLR